MAEVTSGTPTNPLTVIVLDCFEAEALTWLLNSHPTLSEDYPRLDALADALSGPSDLCPECGLEPGDLDCGCRCECQHTCPM